MLEVVAHDRVSELEARLEEVQKPRARRLPVWKLVLGHGQDSFSGHGVFSINPLPEKEGRAMERLSQGSGRSVGQALRERIVPRTCGG